RSFLESDDIRKNLFDVTLAGSYMYNSSTSPYFFRNYLSSSPASVIGLDIWFTPFLAIDGDYRFTMMDELKDSPSQENYVSVSQSWLGVGLKFRRFFGLILNSSSFVFG